MTGALLTGMIAFVGVRPSTAQPAAPAAPASDVAEAASTLNGPLVVDHVMLHAADFEASTDWYVRHLGFRPVVRWTVEGLADTELSYLERAGFLIEFVSAPAGPETAQLPRATGFANHFAQRGFTHLCFRVPDVDAALAALNAAGVPTFAPAIDFPPLNCRVGFVQDPDGNVVEFKGPMAGTNVVNGEAVYADGRED